MITNRVLDHTGSLLSLACAVHCLSVPLLLLLPSTAGAGFLLHGTTELMLLTAAVVLAVCSFCWGYRRHRKGIVLVFLALALCLIGTGWFLVDGTLTRWMTVFGSVLIAGTHLLNQKLCRACPRCFPHR